MDIQESKKHVKATLLALIQEGSDLRDTIEGEYHSKRSKGSFDRVTDVGRWKNLYNAWYPKCIQTLKEVFEPPVLVINRFKNPPMDAWSPSGENPQWAGLMKHTNARLALLDNLYQVVSEIRQEELSDYIELNIPLGVFGKVKVDKIIGKIIR